MSKHTPGPWAVDPLATGAVGDVSTACGNHAVAQAQPRLPLAAGRPDVERAANAVLIAAAPEMLEALEAHNAFWSQVFPDGPDEARLTVGAEQCDVWQRMRAAIAKARGS